MDAIARADESPALCAFCISLRPSIVAGGCMLSGDFAEGTDG